VIVQWLIIGVGVQYAAAAVLFACEEKWGMSVTFAAYALANVGLWMTAR
jgi:hypothetical protein